MTGAKAPHVISEEMVKGMQPGSVIADISVDQGGCVATTKPTTWENPTFVKHGVIHFSVTNMPGSVPRTSTQAISAAILPYVQRLGRDGWKEVESLSKGINVEGGKIIHPALL